MKYVVVLAMVAALCGSECPIAAAQMVINRDAPERVDYPYDTGVYGAMRHWRHFHARRMHAHAWSGRPYAWRGHPYAWRGLRIAVVRSSFPRPEPFGWFTCCL